MTNNDDDVIVDVDETYTFTVTERLVEDYTITTSIIEWLQSNMESVVDDNEHSIFGKVNTGFNESTLKSFGKKPVCDVYIKKVDYAGDFDNHIPIKVHSIIICYLKGANNHTYIKACELHDYLLSELINKESFRTLDNVVRDTHVMNSEINNQPINKKWGVMVAFELEHELYKILN